MVGIQKDSLVARFIRNTGSWKFRVDSIYFQGADASAFEMVSGFPKYEVAAGGNHDCEFRFSPARIGSHNAEIVIITQADTLRQTITGEGVQPRLEVLSDIIDFGKVKVGNHRDTLQAATIKNIGTSPLNIANTNHGGPNDEDFTTIAGGGAFSLQAGDTCKMDLRFEPSEAGRTSGVLEFHYSGVGSPAIVQLYGEVLFAGEASATLQTISIEAEPGDEIEVSIILKNKENLELAGVTSLKTDLSFNSTLLAPLEYQSQNIDQTTAKITLDNLPVDINEDETLTKVRFKVGLGNAEECDLTLSNAEAVGGTADITTINGHFRLLGICREGGDRLINPNDRVQLNISPNPSDEAIRIKFNLIEKGKTEIRLVNVLGETVKTKTIANPKSGLGEAIFETSELPQGIYYIILRTPTVVKSRAVQVLK